MDGNTGVERITRDVYRGKNWKDRGDEHEDDNDSV